MSPAEEVELVLRRGEGAGLAALAAVGDTLYVLHPADGAGAVSTLALDGA
jgi:hypothetical protein